jgi:hypothetical protein
MKTAVEKHFKEFRKDSVGEFSEKMPRWLRGWNTFGHLSPEPI